MGHTPEQHTISDDDMLRHIGYCGVAVTLVALGFAWIANTVV